MNDPLHSSISTKLNFIEKELIDDKYFIPIHRIAAFTTINHLKGDKKI